MRSRTKIVLLAAGAVVVWLVAHETIEHHRQRVIYEQREADFAKKVDAIQRAVPLGSERTAVMDALARQYPSMPLANTSGDLVVWLGREPSFVWYCSFMEPFVQFTFDGDGPHAQLIRIQRKTTGECL